MRIFYFSFPFSLFSTLRTFSGTVFSSPEEEKEKKFYARPVPRRGSGW